MDSIHIYSLGEVGLDFSPHVANSDEAKATQRHFLRHQVAVASELNLPVNVHSRSAGRPVIDLLEECNASNVCLHAFDGSNRVAKRGIANGYYFSIPASVVRSKQKQELVMLLPLDVMLLESDAPALAPIKVRLCLQQSST